MGTIELLRDLFIRVGIWCLNYQDINDESFGRTVLFDPNRNQFVENILWDESVGWSVDSLASFVELW